MGEEMDRRTDGISVRGLRKSFGSVEVLHGIDLEITPGQFVGMMGPNGAGKSTLIKILDGVYTRSQGEILFDGEPVRNLSERPEVGFLHQDLGLIEDLSIVDNLRLAEPPLRLFGPILDKRRERGIAAAALERVGLDYPVETLIQELSPAEKTLVAVARLLNRGASVLFLDEATSTLPPADSNRLINTLRRLIAEEQTTVIMVSHKLSEVLEAADRIVLLLDGLIAADLASTGSSAEEQREKLVSMLVSHETKASVVGRSRRMVNRTSDKVLVSLEDVYGGDVGPLNLELFAGQVAGITGLPGSGLHDVAHLVNGSIKATRGRSERRSKVTGFVPPDRETQGGFEDLSVLDNLTVSALGLWQWPGGLLRTGSMRKRGAEMVEHLAVKPPDPASSFGTLSGGNKQKVIFGRGLLRDPGVYVLCEPTRGVDLATRAAIYELINDLTKRDVAVLVATSDSEDLFAVCDRFAVVVDGQLGDFIWADETNPQELEEFI